MRGDPGEELRVDPGEELRVDPEEELTARNEPGKPKAPGAERSGVYLGYG